MKTREPLFRLDGPGTLWVAVGVRVFEEVGVRAYSFGTQLTPCNSPLFQNTPPHLRIRPLVEIGHEFRPQTRAGRRRDRAIRDVRQRRHQLAVPAAVIGAHRLLDQRVRGVDREVGRGHQHDRARTVVRRYRELVTTLPDIADGTIAAPPGPGLGTELMPDLDKRPDARVRRSVLE